MRSLDADTLATLSDEELARTLQIDAVQLVQVAATIAHNPRSTIEPPGAVSDAPGRFALAGLGAQSDQQGITGGLEIGATLGEGGMGIVRLATQRSLGRMVAVKTLRESARSENATLRLLREAWVTGSLEHPNIVPIYDVGLDGAGSPIIVLKRIEGVDWDILIRDGDTVRERFGATDLLEYNLRILVQLCNAVSLAHARGILHRDLKPENVMIGRFGEVYLVDWGIAVSLEPDPSGRLPLASDAVEMAGTPCYMAPEMMGALGPGRLDARTDVYLLGAVLHEILTGAPPHQGTFRQILGSVLMSSCSYGPEVAPELATIARRAMSREPDDRYPSADAMRLRLEWYLRHRGSLALSAEASERLGELRALVASEAPARDEIYRLFAECRFGFRQALKASSDNVAAGSALREAIEAVVLYELARGTAEAASAALAEHDSPPAELAGRVAVALRARDQEKAKIARLEKLDADLDPRIGRRSRVAVAGLLACLWTVAPQIGGYYERRHPVYSVHVMYIVTTILIVLASGLSRWANESLSKTIVNRGIRATALLAFAGQLALELGGALMRLPLPHIVALHFFGWFTVTSSAAAFLERRLWPSAVGYLVAFLVVSAQPSLRWHAMSASHLLLLVNVLLAWGSLEDRPRRLDPHIERLTRSLHPPARPPRDVRR